MSGIHMFWLASTAALLLAVAVLTGLIVHRVIAERRATARAALHKRLATALMAGEPGLPALASGGRESAVLTDVVLDLLQLVRGEVKADLVGRVIEAGVAGRLHKRLRRGDVRARILAAEALGHFDDPESLAALDAALDDRHREVRLTAALALAGSGHAPPARELVRRLDIGGGEHSLLAGSLLREIAQTDPDDIRSLVLDPGALPAVKAIAAEALAACGDFAMVAPVTALAIAADPWSDELPRYLGALAQIEHPAGAPAILHGLDSPSPAARARAATAAGRIVMREALGKLEGLLADPDWWVRFHAGRALLRLGTDGETCLATVAAGGKAPARETAALTLAERDQAT